LGNGTTTVGFGARDSGLGARGSGLGARDSGLGVRDSGRGSGLGTWGSGLGTSPFGAPSQAEVPRVRRWSVACYFNLNRLQVVVRLASLAGSARWAESDGGRFCDARTQKLSRSRCVEDRHESRAALLSNHEFISARRALHAHCANSTGGGIDSSERGRGTWPAISEGVPQSHQHRVRFSRGVGNVARACNTSGVCDGRPVRTPPGTSSADRSDASRFAPRPEETGDGRLPRVSALSCESDVPNAESRTPNPESRVPSPEPRAPSPEPRAPSDILRLPP